MLGPDMRRRARGCMISRLVRVLLLRLEAIFQPSPCPVCLSSEVAAGSTLRGSIDDDRQGSAYSDAVDYHSLVERLVFTGFLLPFFRRVLQPLGGSVGFVWRVLRRLGRRAP